MKSIIPSLFPHYNSSFSTSKKIYSRLWNIQYWLLSKSILGEDSENYPHNKFDMLFQGAKLVERNILRNFR